MGQNELVGDSLNEDERTWEMMTKTRGMREKMTYKWRVGGSGMGRRDGRKKERRKDKKDPFFYFIVGPRQKGKMRASNPWSTLGTVLHYVPFWTASALCRVANMKAKQRREREKEKERKTHWQRSKHHQQTEPEDKVNGMLFISGFFLFYGQWYIRIYFCNARYINLNKVYEEEKRTKRCKTRERFIYQSCLRKTLRGPDKDLGIWYWGGVGYAHSHKVLAVRETTPLYTPFCTTCTSISSSDAGCSRDEHSRHIVERACYK